MHRDKHNDPFNTVCTSLSSPLGTVPTSGWSCWQFPSKQNTLCRFAYLILNSLIEEMFFPSFKIWASNVGIVKTQDYLLIYMYPQKLIGTRYAKARYMLSFQSLPAFFTIIIYYITDTTKTCIIININVLTN